MTKPLECREFTQEEMDEILKAMPTHTEHCSTVLVGGLRPGNPDHPDFHRGIHEIWMCADDCPLKGLNNDKNM